ncbi:Pyridoxal 5'-phosphate synthase subunit snz1, partial [Coemansia biformis]
MGKKQAAPVPAPQKKPRSLETKVNMARLFTGGVIAVVTSVDQAIIAERFGARGVIVMDTTAEMATRNRTVLLGADPASTRDVMNMTLIPMVGRVRVGHTMEAKVMESCGVTLIDENE